MTIYRVWSKELKSTIHIALGQKLTTGVPQGSILGSLLFDTYVCDLFDSNNAFYFANYADDNTPYITGKSTNSWKYFKKSF